MKTIATVLTCALLSAGCSQSAPERDANLQAVTDLKTVLDFRPAGEVFRLPGDLEAARLPTGIDIQDRWAAIRYGRDRVIVWDLRARTQLFSHVSDRPISSVSLSSHAETVAIQQHEGVESFGSYVSYKRPGDVSLWDTKSGKQIGRVPGAFTRIVFNRQGDRLVAGDGRTMVIYHIADKEAEVLPVERVAPLNKIEEYSEVYPVGFIGDDRTVIAAGDETLLRWQGTGSHPELVKLDYTTHNFDLSGDGKSLVLASGIKGYASIWDTTRMMQVKTWRFPGRWVYIDDIGFDAMGRHVIALASERGRETAAEIARAGELTIEVYETSAARRVWSTRTGFYSTYPFNSFAPTDLLDSAPGLITIRTPVEITLVRQEGSRFALESGPKLSTCNPRLIADSINTVAPGVRTSNPVCRNGYAYVHITNIKPDPARKTDVLLRWSYSKWRILAWGTGGDRLSTSDVDSAGVFGKYVAQLLPEANLVVDN